MSHVVVDNLGKNFAQHQALSEVTFDLPAGRCLALMGNNGAGKSTLLRILAGALLPDHGNAKVCGYDVVIQARQARGVVGTYLGEDRAWYLRVHGRGNLEFFGALRGMRRRELRSRVPELLALVGLTESAGKPVGEYSTGMRARLGLARALMHRPSVLILDEPTRSLDVASVSHFHEVIRTTQSQEGLATVLATHNIPEALQLADRLMVLSSGRVIHACDAEDGMSEELAAVLGTAT